MVDSGETFSDELFAHLRRCLRAGEQIQTLTRGKPNWIVAVDRSGVLVETEKSCKEGSRPQEVPAWMFEAAWQRLIERGVLTNRELRASDDLNVKRSSFVCAALARVPGVTVRSRSPITLQLER